MVVFIDEGQLMSDQVLEVLRGLLNFETAESKLVQLVVASQMEFREHLLSKRNKAIKSRIFAPCMIRPLTVDETVGMISFRCQRAGVPNPFDSRGMERIYEITRGVPRSIVIVCAQAYKQFNRGSYSMMPLDFIEAAAGALVLPTAPEEVEVATAG